MVLEFWQPAAPGEVYVSNAFTGLLGHEAPLVAVNGGEQVGRCRIVDIAVAADGRGATWKVELLEVTGGACGPLVVAWPEPGASLRFEDPPGRPGNGDGLPRMMP